MARLLAGAAGLALLVSLAAAVLGLVVVAAAVGGSLYLDWWLWREHRARVDDRSHRRAELLARAELQHRWFMAGDPRGIYGRYPPAMSKRRGPT
jgi:hypothetical protein